MKNKPYELSSITHSQTLMQDQWLNILFGKMRHREIF